MSAAFRVDLQHLIRAIRWVQATSSAESTAVFAASSQHSAATVEAALQAHLDELDAVHTMVMRLELLEKHHRSHIV